MIVFLFFAQIEAKAELGAVDMNRVLTIGDPFEVVLTVEHPSEVNISEPLVDTLEPFVIVDQQSRQVEESGKITKVYRYRVISFGTGQLKIPAFRLVIQRADVLDTLYSNSVEIKVASVLPPEMEDINDIKGPVRFPNFMPLIVLAILLVAAASGYLGYRYFKKIRRAQALARPLPPPWIEAILALDKIPVDEWLAKGMIKRYYYSLSEILKRYLERRFEFRAAEQTTTEIADNLRLLRVPQREDFSRFFTRADMVKYAKYIPPGSEVASALEAAKALVTETKPEDVMTEEK
jgi:hypothetical protein